MKFYNDLTVGLTVGNTRRDFNVSLQTYGAFLNATTRLLDEAWARGTSAHITVYGSGTAAEERQREIERRNRDAAGVGGAEGAALDG